MREGFGVDFWTHGDERIELDEPMVKQRLRALVDPDMPGAGASWVLSSSHEHIPLIVMIATGSDEWGRDFFDIDFSRSSLLPDLACFRRSIEICEPFEAFIADTQNEADLRAYERQRSFPNFERPAILRWFHYLDTGLVDTVGGIDYCLKAPVFSVKRFADGLLFQLTEEPFENGNAQHRKFQLEAMRYLNLE